MQEIKDLPVPRLCSLNVNLELTTFNVSKVLSKISLIVRQNLHLYYSVIYCPT